MWEEVLEHAESWHAMEDLFRETDSKGVPDETDSEGEEVLQMGDALSTEAVVQAVFGGGDVSGHGEEDRPTERVRIQSAAHGNDGACVPPVVDGDAGGEGQVAVDLLP